MFVQTTTQCPICGKWILSHPQYNKMEAHIECKHPNTKEAKNIMLSHYNIRTTKENING